ncbi:MAG: amidohydrolase [Bacteroidetes bacterium]|nr:MAG: amidohydrolase [Bacteroidota bacterium]
MLIFALIACLGCDKNTPETPPPTDEKVFFSGTIYTVNEAQPWADAVYVRDGVIQYVGNADEARAAASAGAEMVDLEGGFMMPGIHDVHQHPLEASTDNFHFILDDSVTDPEDYAADVAAAAQQNTGTEWLLGWGHWIDVPLSASRPPREILDDVVPDRPVAILEQTSHSVWCNSKALERAGMDENTPDPVGGVIMRAADGSPNGILVDNAGNILLDLALAPTAQSAQNDYEGLVFFALPELAKNGITSICDARTYWKRDAHKVWKRVADENKLTVRVNLGLWAYPNDSDAQLTELASLYENDPNRFLRINQIKLYCDGIIHNTTAAMFDPYLIDYFGLSPNNGLNYFTEQRITQYIVALEPKGFDFHIHTIGNRGVHEALNAIETGGSFNGRHRLTHVEYVAPSDLPRFAALNVTADAQVAGDFTQPDHWHENDYLIDPALNENIVPLKSLYDAGARITLSSDWDVSTLNPFVGLEHAVTRAPQALPLAEAIKAYTINAAYVMRQEDRVGSIEVGKEADLIVLDQNIFEIQPNQIHQTVVLETYLQGRLIYRR